MDRPRTTLTIAEAAWLHQVSEDAFYRRCHRGRVPYAIQVGRNWLVRVTPLRRHLPRLAAELVQTLANGEIEIVRPLHRFAAPMPLTVYRWVSDNGSSSHASLQSHAKACRPEFDTIAHQRTPSSRHGNR